MLSNGLRVGLIALAVVLAGCVGQTKIAPIKVEPCPIKLAAPVCERYEQPDKPYIWTWADYLDLKWHYQNCYNEAINNRLRAEQCKAWTESGKGEAWIK